MSKLDKADLYCCRYYSTEFACCQERLRNLDQQQRTLKVEEALIQERRAAQIKEAQQYQDKLDELVVMLKEQYGIEHQDQVDWDTGEIQEAAPEPPGDPTGSRAGPATGGSGPSGCPAAGPVGI